MTPSDTDATTAPPATPEARRLLMLELWRATLAGLLARLEGDEAEKLTASFFDTCVGFLRDSGISADTVTEVKDALTDMHSDLAQQIKEITAAQDEEIAPPPPPKAESAAVVMPLHLPFEPRPPRT